MRKTILTLALVALAASCAKSPESIAPAYVSDRLYQGLDCDQLAEEQANLQAALSTASQAQSDARTNDIVGIVLLGLPVSTLSGGNVAYQVADLKGQIRAVQQASIRNRCSSSIAHATRNRAMTPARAAATAYATPVSASHAGPAPMFEERVAAVVEAVNRPAGVRSLPTGAGVAQPVNYSANEILAYCRAGWETRQLTDGTTEYNPCFYQ